jgi:N-acetylmuramoyl-L-alanine amidase
LIQTELVSALNLTSRGLKTANFYVLKRTSMPAVLTEVAFISNPREEAFLRDPAFRDRAAQAIAAGIVKYFGAGILKTGEVYDGMFRDVSGHWAEQDIEAAAKLGLVAGKGDGTFGPDEEMTRAQGTVLVLRAYTKLEARIAALEKRVAQLEGRG